MSWSPLRRSGQIVSDISIAVSTPQSGALVSSAGNADQFALHVASLLASGGVDALAPYDQYPAPLYATGPDGYLLYYNHACATIVGRTPRLGIDRWCVCAAIFTMAGEPTDHDTGPMATVLRDALPLRGLEALIEQPGGKRIAVQPYPTPALDDEGRLVGAINLIVPLDGQLHRDLLAKRYRTLARWISDRQAHDSLKSMADECDQQALVLAPIEPDAPRN